MRKIKINENAENEYVADMLTEALYPVGEKVLIIKKYLDNDFSRSMIDDIDANGYPTKIKTVIMLSKDKQPLKTMKMDELVLLLADKFIKMISDENDRKKFLTQVANDWYDKKIDKNGVLSVNFIK